MDNIKQFATIDDIKDEAAEWVVRVHGYTYKTDAKLPVDERQALRAWMDQSQAHRDTFLKMLNSWDAMGVLEELADILPLAEPGAESNTAPHPDMATPRKTHGEHPRRRWRLPAAMGGGLALACTLVLAVFLLGTPDQTQNHYATGIGEQVSYTLGDGSTVHLNTNSEVDIAFTEARRLITLSRGEASFSVAKDADRPFVVSAGQGAVWAVGTVFNVDYSSSIVDVVVSEGTVKVFSHYDKKDNPPPQASTGETTDQRREVMVDAGEAARYKDVIVSKEPLSDAALQRRLAWQEGALSFEGETLAEAIAQISRYTEQQLIIADDSISDARVGGRFKTEDIDQLLDALARSLDIKIEKRDGNRVFFSAR